MSETAKWIDQMRKLLKEAGNGNPSGSLLALLDHMSRIDLTRAVVDLGCGDDCDECSWGDLGGFPLQSTCRLTALQRALEGAANRVSDPVANRRNAMELLALLEALPQPRPH